MAKGREDEPFWPKGEPPATLPPGYTLDEGKDKKIIIPPTYVLMNEREGKPEIPDINPVGEGKKEDLEVAPTMARFPGGGPEPINPYLPVEKRAELEEEDTPEAFFRNELRRMDTPDKNTVGLDSLPSYFMPGQSRVADIVLARNQDEGINEKITVIDNSNAVSSVEVIKAIMGKKQDEILDSELARAYLDDSIARLKKVADNSRESMGIMSEREALCVEKVREKMAGLKAELAAEFRIDLNSLGQEAVLARNLEEGVRSVLAGLRSLERQLESFKDRFSENNPYIKESLLEINRLGKLKDGVKISAKEEKEIERYKYFLPKIKFNEERSKLLADKRKEYESRVERNKNDLDSISKNRIMDRLFTGEVDTKSIAQEMEGEGLLVTIENWREFFMAAQVIEAYVQGNVENLRKAN